MASSGNHLNFLKSRALKVLLDHSVMSKLFFVCFDTVVIFSEPIIKKRHLHSLAVIRVFLGTIGEDI